MDQDKEDIQRAFMQTIVKECSVFFYNMHKFCESYSKKLNEGVPPGHNLNLKQILKKKKVKKRKPGKYIKYFQEQLKILKKSKEGKGMDGRQLSQLISLKWKKLNKKEKERYSPQKQLSLKQQQKSDMEKSSMSYAVKKLWREYNELSKQDTLPFTVGLEDESNVFKWVVMIIGPEGTIYEGGTFQAELIFPNNYPNMPPKMKFRSNMWHPNIYPDGKVCISILHPPEIDYTNQQEQLSEKWRPILGVKEIILSVLSMITAPNLESPANVDAAIQYRDSYKQFKRKVRRMMD